MSLTEEILSGSIWSIFLLILRFKTCVLWEVGNFFFLSVFVFVFFVIFVLFYFILFFFLNSRWRLFQLPLNGLQKVIRLIIRLFYYYYYFLWKLTPLFKEHLPCSWRCPWMESTLYINLPISTRDTSFQGTLVCAYETLHWTEAPLYSSEPQSKEIWQSIHPTNFGNRVTVISPVHVCTKGDQCENVLCSVGACNLLLHIHVVDSCQNRVSANQYHMTAFWAQV